MSSRILNELVLLRLTTMLNRSSLAVGVACTDAARPQFPSLYWPPEDCDHSINYLWDSWRFTLLWTLILYSVFHLGAAAVAIGVQVGKHRSTWKYLWAVPAGYAIVAGLEALVAGSVVGVLSVPVQLISGYLF